MHAQEVYLHPYCLVVTRLQIPLLASFPTTGWNSSNLIIALRQSMCVVFIYFYLFYFFYYNKW